MEGWVASYNWNKGEYKYGKGLSFSCHLAALKPPKETVPSIRKRNGALIKDLLPLL